MPSLLRIFIDRHIFEYGKHPYRIRIMQTERDQARIDGLIKVLEQRPEEFSHKVITGHDSILVALRAQDIRNILRGKRFCFPKAWIHTLRAMLRFV